MNEIKYPGTKYAQLKPGQKAIRGKYTDITPTWETWVILNHFCQNLDSTATSKKTLF